MTAMHDSAQPASIAILAGGKSSRMGVDKALFRIAPDAPPLLEFVVRVVSRMTDDAFIVASDRPEYAAFGLRVVPDAYPGTGSLGGIGSALRHAQHDRCLVVSCDHPFLNPSLLAKMLRVGGDWDALIPVTAGESRQGGDRIRHTLHAIYRRRCTPAIERAIRAGRLQTIAFLGEITVCELDEQWLRRFDPDLRSLFGVNTPEAAAVARAFWPAAKPNHGHEQ